MMRGAHSELIAPPAEESTMSSPLIESSVSSMTSTSSPANGTRLPADRADASGTSSETGKLRSATTSSSVDPTAPVAPRIPTR